MKKRNKDRKLTLSSTSLRILGSEQVERANAAGYPSQGTNCTVVTCTSYVNTACRNC